VNNLVDCIMIPLNAKYKIYTKTGGNNVKNKKIIKPITQPPGFKGELVEDEDPLDLDPTGRYINNNPYKTPPNNLTTKRK
jgi:hypothetical protein